MCEKEYRRKGGEENQIIIQKGVDDAERERVLTTMGEVAYYEVYEFHKIDGIQIITKDYIINSFGEYIEVD